MAELKPCPFCGKRAELISIQRGFAICCEDKNCLGLMQIHYGNSDNTEIFKQKLISNWHKREPEVVAISAALECLDSYREDLREEMQEPYDEHGYCCLRVLDEALNRLQCFTSVAAIKAWNRRAGDGNG